MARDNSDYNKPRTNLFDLLPEVYQSDVNKSVMENLFNRFLTKQETRKVAGYIGKGNPNAITRRQIREFNVHRQGFQLQPILRAKVGTVEWMSSWMDILNEADRLGIDRARLPEWLEVLQFNWVPPIDIDKIAHFSDYYWYDEESINSRPQYITIRSRCSRAIAQANFQQNLVDEFGATILVNRALAVEGTLPTFLVVEVDDVANQVIVEGDATSELAVDQFFEIAGTVDNNGFYQVASTMTYNSVDDRTTIPVAVGSFVSTETVGEVRIRRFDRLVIDDEFIRLFEPGFVFFFKNSSNVELNGAFWQVVDSEYDEEENETIVTINTIFTDHRVDGVISQEEKLNAALAARNCQCVGTIGWDLFQWDDNPENPLWDGEHATLLATISNPGPPVIGSPSPVDGQLWYDTVDDILYQFVLVSSTWKVVWNNFSLILADTVGTGFWDFTPGCGIQSRIPAADQWINQNKWLHKNDVPNFSIAKRAQFPILEFDWDLELNEWTFIDYRWKYRTDKFAPWEETDVNPALIELLPLALWEHDGGTDEIVLDERYGDQTDFFHPGQNFMGVGVGEIFEVESSRYFANAPGQPYKTRIKTTEPFSGLLIPGDLTTIRPSTTPLRPIRTALGDPFRRFGENWLLVEAETAIPVPHQVGNTFAEIDETIIPTPDPSGDTESVSTYYAQTFNVLVEKTSIFPGVTVLELDDTNLAGTTRSLRRRALTGSNDVRVYLNDIRQYGTFEELEDVAISVTGTNVANTSILVDVNITSKISIGETIRIEENTGIGSHNFTVVAILGPSEIQVNDPTTLLPSITSNGVLFNRTTPLEDVDGISYVRGIEFLPGFELDKFDQVLIEVGEATIRDFGLYAVPVRMIEDNLEYELEGDEIVSLIEHRKAEQVKTDTNQYPLFDIYRVTGDPAFKANEIFRYLTSPDEEVNLAVGLRVVHEDDDYSFEQLLVEEDTNVMYAYRDYSNEQDDFWFDPSSNVVWFWTGFGWTDKIDMGDHYRRAIVSKNEPDFPEKGIEGLYWYDLLDNVLKRRNTSTNEWDEIADVFVDTYDNTLQTIWKKGLNDETYVPEKRDWDMRTFEEYTAQRELYVEERAEDILDADESLTEQEAIDIADQEWLDDQKKGAQDLSPSGEWVGDWEIPDPLYYNHMHENRRVVTSRELLTHFTTIIEAQPKIPAFNAPRESMFHLIPTEEVNYGLGGTIKEFNDGFDTWLSALFVNNVTPLILYEFAHDQYESLLNNLREIYRVDASELLTTVNEDSLVDLTAFIANTVIEQHEQNDASALVYGDSTTFTEVLGTNDLGVRNWIATLPYLSLVRKRLPERSIDDNIEVNQVIHHDGHRNVYFLTPATIEAIIQRVIETPDERTRFPSPDDPPLDTFGRITTALPPNDMVEFENEFNTDVVDREGVYWYRVVGPDRTLYRFTVAAIGTDEPSSTLSDGTLWLDLTPSLEVLRIKETDPITGDIDWNIVEGLTPGDKRLHNGTNPSNVTTSTVSAWQVVNLNSILSDIVFEVENRLYNNAPEPLLLDYDFEALEEQYPTLYQQLLEQQFLDYVTQSEIEAPFINSDYNALDAFTWNYHFSTPGTGFQILEADSATNSFVIAGNQVGSFDPCTASAPTFTGCPSQISFFVKNSSANDGTWKTIISTPGTPATSYDALNNRTRIFVDGDVEDSVVGVIYKGTLPASTNTGGESGGDWRDYYQKLYGTPYPHLEPWKLQGYIDKPSYWEEQYRNDDEDKWGERRWKYKHGFDIVGVEFSLDDYFQIDGSFVEVFTNGLSFIIDRSSALYDGLWTVDSYAPVAGVVLGPPGSAVIEIAGNHVGTFQPGVVFAVTDDSLTADRDWPATTNLKTVFTVENSVFTGPPDNKTLIVVDKPIDSSSGLDTIGGSIYDPTTNRTTIRVTAPIPTNVVTGRIAYAYGMWENIRVGIIPPGTDYPNEITSVTGDPVTDESVYNVRAPVIPTYNYFSVNIDNGFVSSDGGTTKFFSDDVLPPFWNFLAHFGSTPAPFDRSIRSVFFSFSIEIVSPGADYTFGDAGPIEWVWRNASQFLYDQLFIAFKIDPLRFFSSSFGPEFVIVGKLLIDRRTEDVHSHDQTEFHGEVVDDQQFVSNGVNQWYSNYNRFTGFDTSYSDFRSLWTTWMAPLMYQFSSFIDTPSLQLAHRHVDLTEFDFAVSAKKSAGVEDYWLDAFSISVLMAPPKVVRFDNQNDWLFEVRTNAPISRTINHYDVHLYQFFADPDTDTCTLYTYPVTSVNKFNETISVGGDQTKVMTEGREFEVTNSTGNDGLYTVRSAVYDPVEKETIIEVEEDVADATKDGRVTAFYRTLPWQTGDTIVFSTSETMPSPLVDENVNGVVEYFIIVLDDRNFRVALTRDDAENGSNIDILSGGRRDAFVGQLHTTFTALNQQFVPTIWRHYSVDKTTVKEFSTPYEIRGIQGIINLVDGYEQWSIDQGWRYNVDQSLRDFSEPTRFVDWQIELERFIDFIHKARLGRTQVADRFLATVDDTSNQWTLGVNERPQFITGDAVQVQSSNNVFPTPILGGLKYYLIRDSLTQFRLAATRNDAEQGNEIDITSTAGVDDLFITAAKDASLDLPNREVNPFRNAIWFRPERGIVSNLIAGPTEDIREAQLLFDQFGRPLTIKEIRVFREDKQTRVTIANNVLNDIRLSSVTEDPYDFIHLGGAHFFIDTYEHVLIFNNYTTEDALVYDPFLGLNITKIEMLFNRQTEFTQRPNVGGHYLETFFNQNLNLNRNWEASVEDMRLLYDTNLVLETNPLMEFSRKTLGYEGTEQFLDNLNLNPKSQFLFWRGQIQHKGATNAIAAFVNSRRFIDAKLDEFWAVKIAEFGSNEEKEYPEMLLKVSDARANDLRLVFAREDDFCQPGFAVDVFDKPNCGFAFPDTNDPVLLTETGFTPIVITDEDRWFEQPDQLLKLRDNGGSMYFDLKPSSMFPVAIGDTRPLDNNDGDGWIDSSTAEHEFNRWNESTFTPYSIAGVNRNLEEFIIDDSLSDTLGSLVYVGQVVEIVNSTGNDGVYRIIKVRRAGSPEQTIVRVDRDITSDVADGTIRFYGVWEPHGSWMPVGSPSSLPFLRHNFQSDFITVTMRWRPEGKVARSKKNYKVLTTNLNQVFELDFVVPNGDLSNLSVTVDGMPHTVAFAGSPPDFSSFVLVSPSMGSPVEVHEVEAAISFPGKEANLAPSCSYIPLTDSIEVFKNGTQLRKDVDYAESLVGSGSLIATSTTILFIDQIGTAELEVHYGVSTLLSDFHYEMVNSNIIRFLFPELANTPAHDIKVWGWLVDKEALNPAKIIDVQSDVVITPVQIWDPARGFHYHNAINVVDLQRDNDPAIYTNTPITDQRPPIGLERSRLYNDPWNKEEVGTTWMDTTNMDYVPYYDEGALTDKEERLRIWGELAPWGEVKIYTWVESDVPPEEWDALAEEEEGDISISANVRKTGRVKQTLFEDVDGEWVRLKNKYDEFDVLVEGVAVSGGYSFTVQNIPSYTAMITSVDTATNEIIVQGDFVNRIEEGSIITIFDSTGSPSNDGNYTVDAVSADDTEATLIVQETIPSTVVDGQIAFFEKVNTYVNNKVRETSVAVIPSVVGSPIIIEGTIVFNNLKEADRVRIQVPVPTDEEFIETEIEAGRLLRQTEFTQDIIVDRLGLEQTRYYFWIENKSTRGGRIMTPREAQLQLVTIPQPYMFPEKLRLEETVSIGAEQSVSRIEQRFGTIGQTTLATKLPIETVTSITVDGTPLVAETDYQFEEGTEEILLTAPLVGDEEIIITYTGVFTDMVDLPHRFVQAITRGLLGVVNDDNRYIMRFTRDFTLRDSLRHGRTPLELKNLHEQWLLIRQEQPNHIPRNLWDRITEAMIGYKLDDSTTRVPSLERELFDTEKGTDTQYGFDEGQAFCSGELALAAILADLENPDNEFTPVDINVFFSRHSFDTAEEIVDSMDTIYNTFSSENVNRIFFSVVHNAVFTQKAKYPDFFKTSMISLHGIRPFQISGVFDD